MKVTLTVTGAAGALPGLEGETLGGFAYLWLKRVTGFNPDECCARSLRGPMLNLNPASLERWPRPRIDVPLELDVKPGAVLYLCGVADGYRYEDNLHLPVEVTGDGTTAKAETYNGYQVRIAGARPLPFPELTEELAAELRPTVKQAACRNYRFGAHRYIGARRA